LTLLLSWCGFLPLVHIPAFAPGEGWVPGLPQFGLGVVGGWIVLLIYVALLGSMMA
jgi:hypothetical protein